MHRSPSVDALLQQVESLSHARRCATLVQFGRGSITHTEGESCDAQNVITALGAPSQVHYHRLLAAFALCGAFAEARRVGRPVPADLLVTASSLLEDSALPVSQLLITSVLAEAPDDDRQRIAMAIEFSKTARIPQFECLVKRLARRKQRQMLLQLYEAQRGANPIKQQLLIGCLGPEVFEQQPKEVEAALGPVALRLLCRHHPQWIGKYLTALVQEQMSLSNAVDATVKELVQKALVLLARRGASKDGLSLFTSTAHLLGLDAHAVKSILERYYLSAFPVEIGSYLLEGEGWHMLEASSSSLSCSMSQRAWKRLKGRTDLLFRLMDKEVLCNAYTCLSKMPVEARHAYFARGYEQLESPNGVVDVSLIRYMPSATERAALAHRFYSHPKLRDFPSERIDYLSLLPFPEAILTGKSYTMNNDARIRGQVIQACLASLQYYPEHLPAALEFCAQRPNEQDLWRLEMLRAWAALPNGFWMRTAAHVADDMLRSRLAQLIQAAYSAKDVSDGTLRELERLLCRLVGPQTSFAVPQLAALIRKRQEFSLGMYDRDVFSGLAQRYPHALPVVAAALLPLTLLLLRSGHAYSCNGILRSLLDNQAVAKVLLRETSAPSTGEPATRSIVRDTLRALMSSTDADAARKSLQLYAKHFAKELAVELPDLIAAEKDWGMVEDVQRLVCSVLQGPLLDTLVSPMEEIPTGRFYRRCGDSTPMVRVLPLEKTHRWTSRQQIMYARSCLQAIGAPIALPLLEYGKFIKILARLPSVPVTTSWTDAHGHAWSLITLATEPHPEHGRHAMRLALQALGQVRGDATAIQVLQNALGVADLCVDALRALATTLQCAPTAEAVRILEPLLTGKQVAAQKEALRLLGAKRDDVAYARIVRFAKECHLPMPTEASGDHSGGAAPSASPATPSSATVGAATAMHRDVRAALVAALVHFLDKPQVWTYFTSIVTQDYVAVQSAEDAEEPVATDMEESENDAEDACTGTSSEGGEPAITPSSAACEEMTTVPWRALRLPWQVREYQTLLRRLLRHPVHDVRVAALHKLATVPPYDDLVLCQVAADYLDECTLPDMAQAALKCMLQCTAEGAAVVITSAILAVQPDASLQCVTNELCGIAKSAGVQEKNALRTIVGALVEKLIAARRQPTIVVSLIFTLDTSEWTSRLTAMEAAGLMHPGAAAAVMNAVQGYDTAICNMDAAESLEQGTLRKHPSALMRRLGLAILVAAGEERGWSEERRESLETYCDDIDLWVSSDARIEQHH
ncbi:hypothetical protein LSCM1_01524 [Leishmania martiniquensis]|uniref:Uncharacterized protein n=1 Tax=Leishmania martiniquensis TaxID=1580590 RepID=A0A836GAS0_9TRYP|nr:hypothetical protein LSCM1_01524 [Leishmania martiniquensis]